MGAAGVALAAAGQHTAGGDFARTGAIFLILHAAALLATSAHNLTRCLALAGFALAAGAILFAADLSARAFFDVRLFPFAVAIGGAVMIAGWIALAIGFACAPRRSAV
ncbi:MAG: DUF423 domain-containing protein [Bradyrhizobium sp.]|nr:MAG: DUF423 domain-containing protein [Bradyrhizobium sp.]